MLLEYESFLIAQKKKNVVTRFFKGNSFIEGCEKLWIVFKNGLAA